MINTKYLLDDLDGQSEATSQWEAALDHLGPHADFKVLLDHLQKAPKDAPTRQYLSDYLSTIQLSKRN